MVGIHHSANRNDAGSAPAGSLSVGVRLQANAGFSSAASSGRPPTVTRGRIPGSGFVACLGVEMVDGQERGAFPRRSTREGRRFLSLPRCVPGGVSDIREDIGRPRFRWSRGAQITMQSRHAGGNACRRPCLHGARRECMCCSFDSPGVQRSSLSVT